MALTPQQIAQMDQALSQTKPQKPNLLSAIGNAGMNITRGASNVARNIGLGAVPDILGSGVLSTEEVGAGVNPFQGGIIPGLNQAGKAPTPQQLQQMYKINPFMSAQTGQNVGGFKTALQDLAGGAGWLSGGLTGVATPVLARAGIGAVSGGLVGASNPQIKNPGDLLTNIGAGAITGGVGNAVIPPVLRGVGNFASRLAYGKAGEAIPAITEETGKTITGIGSRGAKAAVSNIGRKIENVYNQAGNIIDTGKVIPTAEKVVTQPGADETDMKAVSQIIPGLQKIFQQQGINLSKSDLMNFASDEASRRYSTGLGNSPLDELVNKLNITDSNQLSEAKSYIAPSSSLIKRGVQGTAQKSGVSFAGDFKQSLNTFLEKDPALNVYIKQNGGVANIDQIKLPPSFWSQFASDLSNKVPYDKITDPVTGAADYSKLGGRQSMQAAVASNIRNQLRNYIGQSDPSKLSELERLNGLYGSAKAIASGKAKGVIHPELMARYGLALPAVLGAGAIQQKNTALSPFLAMMAAVSALANPSISGPVASTIGMPAIRAAIPAISGLLGSRSAQQQYGGQQ